MLTPYEFGLQMGKQAVDWSRQPGTYSGGIRTHDAQGNAVALNPAQQQHVAQIAKIRAQQNGGAPPATSSMPGRSQRVSAHDRYQALKQKGTNQEIQSSSQSSSDAGSFLPKPAAKPAPASGGWFGGPEAWGGGQAPAPANPAAITRKSRSAF